MAEAAAGAPRPALEEYVAAFEAARARDEDTDPADFLPPPDDPLRLRVLCELVRIDLEFGWERDRLRPLAHYQAAFPALFQDSEYTQRVVFEEYRLRLQAGERPARADYARRFGVATDDWPEPDGGDPTAGGAVLHRPTSVRGTPSDDGLLQAAAAYWAFRQDGAGDRPSAVDSWCASYRGNGEHAQFFRDLHRSNPDVAERQPPGRGAAPGAGGRHRRGAAAAGPGHRGGGAGGRPRTGGAAPRSAAAEPGRVGDLRVSGVPMPANPDAAVATPFDVTAGTWAGDVRLNSAANFSAGGYDLYTVALHETGHALGLDHIDDPASVMYEDYLGPRTGLSAMDVQAIRALYGARVPDAFEGSAGNGSLSAATPLVLPKLADGSLALTVNAELTTQQDADYYRFTTPLAVGGLTVRLLTSGQSLLTSRVTLYNSSGKALASAVATDPSSGDLVIQLPSASILTTYYVKVEKAAADAFGVGS